MSAHMIYDLVQLGSLVRYSDGTPRPPEHPPRDRAIWKENNGRGLLVRKMPARHGGKSLLPASFVLREGRLGLTDSVALVMHQTFSVGSRLTFEVMAPPAIGSVRILDRHGELAELLHLAADRASARLWLETHRCSGAVLDEITARRGPIWSCGACRY